MGVGVLGSGFQVWGFGSWIQGTGFEVWVSSFEFRVQGLGYGYKV